MIRGPVCAGVTPVRRQPPTARCAARLALPRYSFHDRSEGGRPTGSRMAACVICVVGSDIVVVAEVGTVVTLAYGIQCVSSDSWRGCGSWRTSCYSRSAVSLRASARRTFGRAVVAGQDLAEVPETQVLLAEGRSGDQGCITDPIRSNFIQVGVVEEVETCDFKLSFSRVYSLPVSTKRASLEL